MKKITYLSILIHLMLFIACDGNRMTEKLEAISQIANNKPDSALSLLKLLEPEKDHWSKADRMHFELVRHKAENKAYITFTTDTIIKEVVDYYKQHGTANERMEANYLLGRVYADMGEAPQALQAYYDAIENADTTSSDCDYGVLIPVYGQMSVLFHQQNLPHDEIWALKHYIEYIRRTDSEKEYLKEKTHMISPYYLLGKKDTVLQIINDSYNALRAMGEDKDAAAELGVSLQIYLERGQIDKTRQAMEIFEKESGLFDKEGNIAKGREHYYYTKGSYELAVNNIDSAEYYYRKAIKYGHLYDGYRGLMKIYRARKVSDSVAHYSLLFESAMDSLHNQKDIDAIHKMSSLYNYSRLQKIAEQEAQKVQKVRFSISIILSILLLGILLFVLYYRRYKRKKQAEIAALAANLSSAQEEYQKIQEELQQLKGNDYHQLIVEREMRSQELKLYIEKYTKVQELSAISDNLNAFESSKIADVFRNKKDSYSSKTMPTKAEWRLLEVQFSKDMPVSYKVLAEEKKLSPLELRVCILLILDFEDSSIVNLTDSIPQTISNAKSRANKKIFNEKGAQTLKASLLRLIKHD